MTEGYREAVNFRSTANYGCGPEDEDDVYTVEEFRQYCKSGMFIDYDGYGYPVKDKLSNPSIIIKPSALQDIPEDATHIVWFNR